MIVEQIYTSCLSQGSYYIESNNEVAIIDPIREIDSYIAVSYTHLTLPTILLV